MLLGNLVVVVVGLVMLWVVDDVVYIVLDVNVDCLVGLFFEVLMDVVVLY